MYGARAPVSQMVTKNLQQTQKEHYQALTFSCNEIIKKFGGIKLRVDTKIGFSGRSTISGV